MKNEMKKAHDMITDFNQQVDKTNKQVISTVQDSTSKTSENLLTKLQ